QPCRANPALAPILLVRGVLEETKSELQKMEEQQEMRNTMLEQMVTDTANQMNEQMQEIVGGVQEEQEEQEKAKAECLKCTFDLNEHLGELLQRCEKLQEQVDSLESQQMGAPLAQCYIFPSLDQHQNRLHHVETTILQIQGNCEKLSFTSGSLQKDSQQNQKAIEV
ncbi:QRIC2 protein, partial [Sterrhoptilus dennistouni]|nr:QRIC2 protein [Sterrhoptilus dennistouni]